MTNRKDLTVGQKYRVEHPNLNVPTRKGTLVFQDHGDLVFRDNTDNRLFVISSDLIGVVFTPVKKHKRWVNFYNTVGYSDEHTHRADADRTAYGARIACIEVEFEEGEGLK